MKNNGFTLIELLAVIVILAIIALIATPIILGIINDAKEESNKRSVEMYAKAVENAIAQAQLNNQVVDSKVYSTSNLPITVEYDGDVDCTIVEVKDDGSIYIDDCTVNGENVEYSSGIEGENHLSKTYVKAVTEETKTTGTVPTINESGNIEVGSEFRIKVNDTLDYTSFFVLSNEGEYVNLIAQQNITSTGEFTSEPQDNDEWYSAATNNKYGPQTAYTYLSTATSDWINIPIIENFNYLDEGNKANTSYGYQGITTKLDETTGKYVTTITPHSSLTSANPSTYENMRTRLPYYSEIKTNTSCKISTDSSFFGSCPLWLVNYLKSDDYYTGKTSSEGNNQGYWTLTAYPNGSSARFVQYSGLINFDYTNKTTCGVRPVITILKSDLLRVM